MNILSIGGSDPSSGAGIQGDLRVISKLRAYSLNVITAITSQNTASFGKIYPVSPKMVLSQMDYVLSDFQIDTIIISMVYNKSIIDAIHSKLKKIEIPIIVDPVITSTTGGKLLLSNALQEYIKNIVPLATIITPNVKEAETITEKKILNERDVIRAAREIQSLGANNVVITGIDQKDKIKDFVLIKDQEYWMSNKKLLVNNHGSGCTFSAAIAVSIAKGRPVRESVIFARKIALQSIRNAKSIGKGISITDLEPTDKVVAELSNEIIRFSKIKNAYPLIPECQTNFVFAKEKPRTLLDIAGVLGRIVKSGKDIRVAGDIEYGGSKHVASALLEMNKKFPEVRSAINIKFDWKILENFKKNELRITKYDRRLEPDRIKKIENSSISWGISRSIRNEDNPPDVVYHEGDYGKEPMIIVFGMEPKDVMYKIKRILPLKDVEKQSEEK